MNLIVGIVLGLGVGVLAVVAAIYGLAESMMIVESPSKLGYEETVGTIVESAEGCGWSVPVVHQLDVSVAEGGFEVPPATVIELCKPELAAEILADESSRKVTSMMPCRISVYERADGSVTVSRMNTGLISRFFGGLVARVMGRATGDSEAILASVL